MSPSPPRYRFLILKVHPATPLFVRINPNEGLPDFGFDQLRSLEHAAYSDEKQFSLALEEAVDIEAIAVIDQVDELSKEQHEKIIEHIWLWCKAVTLREAASIKDPRIYTEMDENTAMALADDFARRLLRDLVLLDPVES